MQLKNALVGAVVGGAIGVGVLIAAYFLFGADHMALAIVVAILTGLGVRLCVATKGHASYARGAVTALLAISAFVGGKFLVAEIASRQATVSVINTRAKAAPALTDDTTDQDAAEGDVAEGESPPTPEQIQLERSAGRPPVLGDIPRGQHLKDSLTLPDFLWLFGAALIAYELGRGSGMAPPAPAATPEPTAT